MITTVFVLALVAASAGTSPAPVAVSPGPPASNPGPGFDARWSRVSRPSAGPPLAIGQPGAGCLQGASVLLSHSRDYVIVHPERHRVFGHPDLIRFLRALALAARRQGLGPLYIGDLGQARGGPTPSGHRSHQNGLDVDLWYGQPQRGPSLEPPTVVDLRTHRMMPAWNRRAVRLLELAASQAPVDRIFVNPAVKRALCEDKRSRGPWLAKLRPWWGHHDHFHVRLRCPTSSPECAAQPPLAPGEGCDASLAWWFSADAHRTGGARPPPGEAGPAMPQQCEALLSEQQR